MEAFVNMIYGNRIGIVSLFRYVDTDQDYRHTVMDTFSLGPTYSPSMHLHGRIK